VEGDPEVVPSETLDREDAFLATSADGSPDGLSGPDCGVDAGGPDSDFCEGGILGRNGIEICNEPNGSNNKNAAAVESTTITTIVNFIYSLDYWSYRAAATVAAAAKTADFLTSMCVNYTMSNMNKESSVSALRLDESPSLQDFQKYIAEMIVERGFRDETIPETFMLFMEECGEFAKAARKFQGMKTDAASEKFALEHEAAVELIVAVNHSPRGA